MKRWFVLIIFFLTSLVFASDTHAAENWIINKFDVDIAIEPSGQVKIVEDIQADFGAEQKHGIFRDIPVVYTRTSGERLYTKIQVENVTDGNSSVPYETFTNG